MRDIWSFSRIWQDFAKFAPHMTNGIDGDSSRHGPAFCRNLLLTIDVFPFLSIAADTPTRRGARNVGRNRIDHPWSQLCRRRRTATLCGGMMPFEKIEKSLHEGH
ncbi:hypothetical protein [Mesorhizobium sangaii]|uniref:Uncharacterized protein n=1 Tax=Mesorhizobium sangaii TaxID=505389 RepID=A0A841PAS5_9HYPH|nr:hypothetical protein [Mesorhizobium sangaii]MBB6408010.1 hypothetical protein [Mesorhizobium sangaii]